jgi:hypothetical protein
MGQMDKVTQGNASSAEESASAAEELDAQAETMKDLVSQLRTLVGGASSEVSSTVRTHAKPSRSGAASHAPASRKSIPMPGDEDGDDSGFRNF